MDKCEQASQAHKLTVLKNVLNYIDKQKEFTCT